MLRREMSKGGTIGTDKNISFCAKMTLAKYYLDIEMFETGLWFTHETWLLFRKLGLKYWNLVIVPAEAETRFLTSFDRRNSSLI